MNRDTGIRVWDALHGERGEYLVPVRMETAVSLGMSGTHPGSCDWDIEFSTGATDKNGKDIFQGDIVSDSDWFYVVRFGEEWIPFADSRDGCDDIGGKYTGFYCEPLEKKLADTLYGKFGRGEYSGVDDSPRPFSSEGGYLVVGNIRENPEWEPE